MWEDEQMCMCADRHSRYILKKSLNVIAKQGKALVTQRERFRVMKIIFFLGSRHSQESRYQKVRRGVREAQDYPRPSETEKAD